MLASVVQFRTEPGITKNKGTIEDNTANTVILIPRDDDGRDDRGEMTSRYSQDCYYLNK